MKKTEYVLGFAFSSIERADETVVLIRKNKPDWQAGKFNGVGGKLESNEVPLFAMVREFKEETGVTSANWLHVCTLFFEQAEVHVFAAFSPTFAEARTTESEQVKVMSLRALTWFPHMTNLDWLIPMSLVRLRTPDENPPMLVEEFPK